MAEAALGDKQAAIDNYAKAIKLSDPKERNSPIPSYKHTISALGGTP